MKVVDERGYRQLADRSKVHSGRLPRNANVRSLTAAPEYILLGTYVPNLIIETAIAAHPILCGVI